MSTLFNIDYEKQLISSIIRSDGALLADIPLINDKDFSTVNRTVFQAIQTCLATSGKVNKFTLVSYLQSLNIKIGGEIDPGIYIPALELLDVNDRAGIEIAKQLKKWTTRRELNSVGREIVEFTQADKNVKDFKAAEMLSEVTKIFNHRTNILGGTDEQEPADLYGTMDEFLDRETAFDRSSLVTPYPLFNDFFGNLDPGNIYVFGARAKTGKSTLLLSTLQQMAQADTNNEFVALILDTELTLDEVQSRAIASLTGIKEYYIRSKKYKNYPDMRKKVEEARKIITPLFNHVKHQFVGNMSLEEQLSLTRRWVKKFQQLGKKCLIVLDYIKLGMDDYNGKVSRDIIAGNIVNQYKNLVKELEVPLLTFVQANRDGEDSKTGGRMDNGTVIGLSDMINQFSSNVMLLAKLSDEERAFLRLGKPGDATHSLKKIYTRQEGPNESGKARFVKWVDSKGKDRYCENYLLYAFDNFNVREVGDFHTVWRNSHTGDLDIQNSPPADQVNEELPI